jgi:hypothetical protein
VDEEFLNAALDFIDRQHRANALVLLLQSDTTTNRFSTTNGSSITYSSRYPMQALAANWLASFREFPARQKPASLNLDEVMAKFEKTGSGAN